MLWFTADLHFGHANILGGNQRPFSSLDEMERTLIANINERVAADDHLYVLGDFAYGASVERTRELRNKIACKNVHLVHGNHDEDFSETEAEAAGGDDVPAIFTSEQDYLEIAPGFAKGHKLVLFHYPIMSWNGKRRGSLMLHGHIHSHGAEYNEKNRARNILRYDVGVDANDYAPISRDEILAFFKDELKNY